MLTPDPAALAPLELAAFHELARAVLPRGGDRAGLTFQTVERRNRTLLARREDGSGFVIKRPPPAGVPSYLREEAGILRHLWEVDPTMAARWVPPLVTYDSDRDVLVTELLIGARSVHDHHRRVGRTPRWVGRAIGEALAWLHAVPVREGSFEVTRAVRPSAMLLHEPTLEEYARMSPAQERLVAIAQSLPGLIRALDELGREWTSRAIVHGDLRFDNVLVAGGSRSIRLIDWELAGLGDPAWDVGAAFAGYLESWIVSFPIARSDALRDSAGAATLPIEAVRPVTAALWAAYRARSRHDDVQRFLRRCVLFVAARLLASAYERASGQPDLLGHDALLVQVADNVVARPGDAADQLLGVGPVAS